MLLISSSTIPQIERSPEGPTQAAKKLIRQILQDHTGIQIALDDMFGEGDRIAVRDHFLGTRVSDGKQVKVQSISVSRLLDGKVVEVWQLIHVATEGGPGDKQ